MDLTNGYFSLLGISIKCDPIGLHVGVVGKGHGCIILELFCKRICSFIGCKKENGIYAKEVAYWMGMSLTDYRLERVDKYLP